MPMRAFKIADFSIAYGKIADVKHMHKPIKDLSYVLAHKVVEDWEPAIQGIKC